MVQVPHIVEDSKYKIKEVFCKELIKLLKVYYKTIVINWTQISLLLLMK